ncbi:MAG: TetR family transcriptional regulator [Micavibrio aeruginosavorus]|uniref:TetR family transcriptional regulator n=1 Tax=Micavibrio aeruginosavorus TaxID=349221 RepID=A0A2W5FK89_9BACT|nr:MAG: TetR family transcriptional regulator [Micavibrio aeruginosavorus]
MPPKPAPKKQKPPFSAKDGIIDAALKLAAVQGWSFITVRDISHEAGLDLAGFYEVFDCKDDIVTAYGRRLDQKVLQNFSDIHPETPVRDLIFDVIMERFDLANRDREGLKSILNSMKLDPKQFFLALPQLSASMTRMLEAAGIDAYGPKGAIRVAGLTASVAWVTRTWLEDESQDLSKTMAALDKALGRIEGLAEKFGL